jgi:hypothetical protein
MTDYSKPHWLAIEALKEIESAASACEAAALANRETCNWDAHRIETTKAIAYRNAARAIADRLARSQP